MHNDDFKFGLPPESIDSQALAPETLAPETLAPETLAVHAAIQPDPQTKAIAPNIVMSVNHSFLPNDGAFSAQGMQDLADAPFLYAGWTNPTVRLLEERLAILEQAEDGLATASGMAAITAVFMSLLKAGDHLVISDVCYAAVFEFATQVLPQFGIEVSAVDTTCTTNVQKALRENTKLVHIETPCNPLLRLSDIKALSSLLKSRGILLSADSTFSTPVITRPLDLGADLVVHSLTKFINGHGDVLGGCVLGSKALIGKLRSVAGVYFGASLSPQSAWLIMRGMETIYPRMKTLCESAHAIANWLENNPNVQRVLYPGLESHQQFSLAKQQMAFFGGIIAFQVEDIELIEQRFAHESKMFYYAYSIGHQRSLAVVLKTDDLDKSTYRFSPEQKANFCRDAGKGVVRLSIGLESPVDLIRDLSHLLR
ncbi:PLP-dependent aspartate aminotransferase family protein [Vibrio natriegens]|uniref:trans-sulfuration enzyme family protein n=1 Tax=Vibrio natriegens TaxID=691 RepID=UPI001EFC5BF8|nr:PLP-dependent aspartate aminotransferase family protein [Vibrio natriegens]MCG9700513.1 PLP-dependent aspartate aminotransferase family protein [Vibrio natriegens]